MYKLTLTHQERAAIDWIGYRYFHGDDLKDILNECERTPDSAWNSQDDITFEIPEYLAWTIRDEAEQEDFLFSCFGPDLALKMIHFCHEIV